jgi:Flp pilus assembly secretin CpaC
MFEADGRFFLQPFAIGAAALTTSQSFAVLADDFGIPEKAVASFGKKRVVIAPSSPAV